MRRVNLAMFALMALGSGPSLTADTITFLDGDFPDGNWTIPESLFLDASQTGQQLTGGNPGAYRQTGVIFAERPDYSANLNLTFLYTPAIQGVITGITYNMDLKAISAIGSTYYPLISQGGALFYDSFAGAYNSENIWINYNLPLDLGQFVPLHGGSTRPDFTSGSTITFRYLVTTGRAGFYESITGIDNDPITLTTTAAANVPEPPSGILFGMGAMFACCSLTTKRQRELARSIGAFGERNE